MTKKSFFKKSLWCALGALLLAIVYVPAFSASQPRDYNGNAIMYGGAYSISELINKTNNGTGKPHQGPGELKALYKKMGMDPGWFGRLVNGTVYKDGRVVVGNKTVKRNVYTAGRHYMPGSTRDSRFSYPIYWRHPSVSFNSKSLQAYVLMNYDGTMAFAILKACGNPVKGVGVRIKPVPKYSLTIKKFNDMDNDKVKDANEAYLPGWTFLVEGKNYEKSFTTGKDGSVTATGLLEGTYTVKETMKSGWESTTGITRSISIKGANAVLLFGNRSIPEKPKPSDTYTIKARKFEDLNGNGEHEANEPWLKDWNIKLTSSDHSLDREFLTDEEGTVYFTNLEEGTYTITETMQAGWKNITPISQQVTVPDAETLEGYVEFGNQKIPKKVTPKGTVVKPTPLPEAGPAEMIGGIIGSIGIFSAGSYYLKSKKKLSDSFKKF